MLVLTLAFATLVAAPQDSTPRPRRDSLEAVVVRATRAGASTPASRTIITRDELERRGIGQDAPLALAGSPAITVASDAGSFSGYSSLRLRGIDQTRLSISVDGIPLNDPEDQVLYFSNVPDFLNSMQSVQVQRGVGSSAFGTAAFGGSLNFESIPIAAAPRGVEAQLTGGSWGTGRVSLEGTTGLRGRWAAYGRLSAQSTDGYRDHSGNESSSGFASVGWFGDRDALRLTTFAGRSRMRLSYYAASEAELRIDPRHNPMSPDERDDFHQEMIALQHTRVLRPGATLTTTAYRNSAAGDYDVSVGGGLWNFNLDHAWYGLLSAVNVQHGALTLDAGAHASQYARDHFLFIKPDLSQRIYDNTGFKQEQSAFVKGALSSGAVSWSADLQLRRAAFRYRPTAGSGFADPTVDWVFLNPKVGVSWQLRPALSLYASVGRSGREPTRSDLFAGADDLDAAAATELLPLDRVRPERVTDIEAGASWRRSRGGITANLFAMEFREEIAAIGALTLNGSQRRANVGRGSRRGIELEGEWRPRSAMRLSGNLTLMRARIGRYTDAATGVSYANVAPILTPAVMANAVAEWKPNSQLALSLSARHVGESQLAPDGNAALVTPAFTVTDAAGEWRFGAHALRVQLQNLLDATAYQSGYTDGSSRYFFPLASRSVFLTLVLRR